MENHKTENWNKETAQRVRIRDIADELGVSTATVSNVIHGKTAKISDRTVQRVQEQLERREYVPNMAAVLLAQNSSKIICVVISNEEKYEGRVLEDPFVSALSNYLAVEIEKNQFFMMVKIVDDVNEVIQYASMWNMAGLILIGFCEQDYDSLRNHMRIPFVVMDGFFEPNSRCANVGIDDFDGGCQMGKYLLACGHEEVIFLADNDESMDHARFQGICKAFEDLGKNVKNIRKEIVPLHKQERMAYYDGMLGKIGSVTAIFCASDYYGIEIMNYLQDHGYLVPEDISVAAFDDIPAATIVRPALTTIRQDISMRARSAIGMLMDLMTGSECERHLILPAELVKRSSVAVIRDRNTI